MKQARRQFFEMERLRSCVSAALDSVASSTARPEYGLIQQCADAAQNIDTLALMSLRHELLVTVDSSFPHEHSFSMSCTVNKESRKVAFALLRMEGSGSLFLNTRGLIGLMCLATASMLNSQQTFEIVTIVTVLTLRHCCTCDSDMRRNLQSNLGILWTPLRSGFPAFLPLLTFDDELALLAETLDLYTSILAESFRILRTLPAAQLGSLQSILDSYPLFADSTFLFADAVYRWYSKCTTRESPARVLEILVGSPDVLVVPSFLEDAGRRARVVYYVIFQEQRALDLNKKSAKTPESPSLQDSKQSGCPVRGVPSASSTCDATYAFVRLFVCYRSLTMFLLSKLSASVVPFYDGLLGSRVADDGDFATMILAELVAVFMGEAVSSSTRDRDCTSVPQRESLPSPAPSYRRLVYPHLCILLCSFVSLLTETSVGVLLLYRLLSSFGTAGSETVILQRFLRFLDFVGCSKELCSKLSILFNSIVAEHIWTSLLKDGPVMLMNDVADLAIQEPDKPVHSGADACAPYSSTSDSFVCMVREHLDTCTGYFLTHLKKFKKYSPQRQLGFSLLNIRFSTISVTKINGILGGITPTSISPADTSDNTSVNIDSICSGLLSGMQDIMPQFSNDAIDIYAKQLQTNMKSFDKSVYPFDEKKQHLNLARGSILLSSSSNGVTDDIAATQGYHFAACYHTQLSMALRNLLVLYWAVTGCRSVLLPEQSEGAADTIRTVLLMFKLAIGDLTTFSNSILQMCAFMIESNVVLSDAKALATLMRLEEVLFDTFHRVFIHIVPFDSLLGQYISDSIHSFSPHHLTQMPGKGVSNRGRLEADIFGFNSSGRINKVYMKHLMILYMAIVTGVIQADREPERLGRLFSGVLEYSLFAIVMSDSGSISPSQLKDFPILQGLLFSLELLAAFAKHRGTSDPFKMTAFREMLASSVLMMNLQRLVRLSSKVASPAAKEVLLYFLCLLCRVRIICGLNQLSDSTDMLHTDTPAVTSVILAHTKTLLQLSTSEETGIGLKLHFKLCNACAVNGQFNILQFACTILESIMHNPIEHTVNRIRENRKSRDTLANISSIHSLSYISTHGTERLVVTSPEHLRDSLLRYLITYLFDSDTRPSTTACNPMHTSCLMSRCLHSDNHAYRNTNPCGAQHMVLFHQVKSTPDFLHLGTFLAYYESFVLGFPTKEDHSLLFAAPSSRYFHSSEGLLLSYPSLTKGELQIFAYSFTLASYFLESYRAHLLALDQHELDASTISLKSQLIVSLSALSVPFVPASHKLPDSVISDLWLESFIGVIDRSQTREVFSTSTVMLIIIWQWVFEETVQCINLHSANDSCYPLCVLSDYFSFSVSRLLSPLQALIPDVSSASLSTSKSVMEPFRCFLEQYEALVIGPLVKVFGTHLFGQDRELSKLCEDIFRSSQADGLCCIFRSSELFMTLVENGPLTDTLCRSVSIVLDLFARRRIIIRANSYESVERFSKANNRISRRVGALIRLVGMLAARLQQYNRVIERELLMTIHEFLGRFAETRRIVIDGGPALSEDEETQLNKAIADISSGWRQTLFIISSAFSFIVSQRLYNFFYLEALAVMSFLIFLELFVVGVFSQPAGIATTILSDYIMRSLCSVIRIMLSTVDILLLARDAIVLRSDEKAVSSGKGDIVDGLILMHSYLFAVAVLVVQGQTFGNPSLQDRNDNATVLLAGVSKYYLAEEDKRLRYFSNRNVSSHTYSLDEPDFLSIARFIQSVVAQVHTLDGATLCSVIVLSAAFAQRRQTVVSDVFLFTSAALLRILAHNYPGLLFILTSNASLSASQSIHSLVGPEHMAYTGPVLRESLRFLLEAGLLDNSANNRALPVDRVAIQRINALLHLQSNTALPIDLLSTGLAPTAPSPVPDIAPSPTGFEQLLVLLSSSMDTYTFSSLTSVLHVLSCLSVIYRSRFISLSVFSEYSACCKVFMPTKSFSTLFDALLSLSIFDVDALNASFSTLSALPYDSVRKKFTGMVELINSYALVNLRNPEHSTGITISSFKQFCALYADFTYSVVLFIIVQLVDQFLSSDSPSQPQKIAVRSPQHAASASPKSRYADASPVSAIERKRNWENLQDTMVLLALLLSLHVIFLEHKQADAQLSLVLVDILRNILASDACVANPVLTTVVSVFTGIDKVFCLHFCKLVTRFSGLMDEIVISGNTVLYHDPIANIILPESTSASTSITAATGVQSETQLSLLANDILDVQQYILGADGAETILLAALDGTGLAPSVAADEFTKDLVRFLSHCSLTLDSTQLTSKTHGSLDVLFNGFVSQICRFLTNVYILEAFYCLEYNGVSATMHCPVSYGKPREPEYYNHTLCQDLYTGTVSVVPRQSILARLIPGLSSVQTYLETRPKSVLAVINRSVSSPSFVEFDSKWLYSRSALRLIIPAVVLLSASQSMPIQSNDQTVSEEQAASHRSHAVAAAHALISHISQCYASNFALQFLHDFYTEMFFVTLARVLANDPLDDTLHGLISHIAVLPDGASYFDFVHPSFGRLFNTTDPFYAPFFTYALPLFDLYSHVTANCTVASRLTHDCTWLSHSRDSVALTASSGIDFVSYYKNSASQPARFNTSIVDALLVSKLGSSASGKLINAKMHEFSIVARHLFTSEKRRVANLLPSEPTYLEFSLTDDSQKAFDIFPIFQSLLQKSGQTTSTSNGFCYGLTEEALSFLYSQLQKLFVLHMCSDALTDDVSVGCSEKHVLVKYFRTSSFYAVLSFCINQYCSFLEDSYDIPSYISFFDGMIAFLRHNLPGTGASVANVSALVSEDVLLFLANALLDTLDTNIDLLEEIESFKSIVSRKMSSAIRILKCFITYNHILALYSLFISSGWVSGSFSDKGLFDVFFASWVLISSRILDTFLQYCDRMSPLITDLAHICTSIASTRVARKHDSPLQSNDVFVDLLAVLLNIIDLSPVYFTNRCVDSLDHLIEFLRQNQESPEVAQFAVAQSVTHSSDCIFLAIHQCVHSTFAVLDFLLLNRRSYVVFQYSTIVSLLQKMYSNCTFRYNHVALVVPYHILYGYPYLQPSQQSSSASSPCTETSRLHLFSIVLSHMLLYPSHLDIMARTHCSFFRACKYNDVCYTKAAVNINKLFSLILDIHCDTLQIVTQFTTDKHIPSQLSEESVARYTKQSTVYRVLRTVYAHFSTAFTVFMTGIVSSLRGGHGPHIQLPNVGTLAARDAVSADDTIAAYKEALPQQLMAVISTGLVSTSSSSEVKSFREQVNRVTLFVPNPTLQYMGAIDDVCKMECVHNLVTTRELSTAILACLAQLHLYTAAMLENPTFSVSSFRFLKKYASKRAPSLFEVLHDTKGAKSAAPTKLFIKENEDTTSDYSVLQFIKIFSEKLPGNPLRPYFTGLLYNTGDMSYSALEFVAGDDIVSLLELFHMNWNAIERAVNQADEQIMLAASRGQTTEAYRLVTLATTAINHVYRSISPHAVTRARATVGGLDMLESALRKHMNFIDTMAYWSAVCVATCLGDRHIFNILGDRSDYTVHFIDFEAVFDYGRMLRYSELVPFRLSPLIVQLLGMTGVHGRFYSRFVAAIRLIQRDIVAFRNIFLPLAIRLERVDVLKASVKLMGEKSAEQIAEKCIVASGDPCYLSAMYSGWIKII